MAITEQHKRRKHSHGEQNALSIDRISDLPDSVLCHILSFLSTKDSVRTSVLGKRWRFLWAYVLDLDFHDENQLLINSVLLLRKVQTVDYFGLVHEIDCDARQLETWVSFAIMRNVQKLGLHFRSQDALPRCLFTCETLVCLTLSTCGVIPNVGSTVCLPCLKILYLIDVQFEADESLPHLLSGCPVLQELEIRLETDMVYCNVSSPTLERLMLDFMYDGYGGMSNRLEMNTPALEYLKINNYSCEHIECGLLTSLIEAEIIFYNDDRDYFHLYSRSVLKFVHSLCNVKCLKLDFSSCAEIVDPLLSAWAISYCNLTKLQLKADYRVLSNMLEKADNLEILIFTEYCEETECWTAPQQVPTCLLSSLRSIELVGIKGKKHEFKLIRYLLRNSKVLEGLIISYGRRLSLSKELKMLKKISLFERGSTTCEVGIVGGN